MNFVRLGEVSDSVMGQAPPGKACNKEGTGTPFVKAGEFSDRFPVIREWTTDPLKHSKVGDVLICVVGATAGKINQGIDCAIGRSVAAIRPDARRLNSDYLYYFMRQRTDEMRAKSQGLAQGVITRDMIAEIEISLPPLEQQKRIAAILDQADELRRKRQRALDRLNQFGQAIFIEMFGDATKHEIAIEDLIADGSITVHKDGNHGSNYPRKEEFGEHGVPFLSATAIDENGQLIPEQVQYLNEGKARTLKIGWIEKGDVLLSHNASVGKVALYKGEFGAALIGTSLTCFRPNSEALTPDFLCLALQGSRFQSQLTINMSQTTRNQVPITAQRKLKIARPPLDQQKRISEILADVTAERERFLLSLQHLNKLFASLQHRAFRGGLTASSLKGAAA